MEAIDEPLVNPDFVESAEDRMAQGPLNSM